MANSTIIPVKYHKFDLFQYLFKKAVTINPLAVHYVLSRRVFFFFTFMLDLLKSVVQ